jgi:hypothetical protein
MENKIDIEIEDDTPPEDQGRRPMPTPPEDPTDEELSAYDDKVKNRIRKFSKGYHDERRAKEEALREREAAEEFARKIYEENKALKNQLEAGSKVFIDGNKSSAQMELEYAKKKLKEAFEAGDSDALVEAQDQVAKANLKLHNAENMRPIEHFENVKPPERPTQNITPRTKRWVEENSEWFGKDEEMTMMAMGLDKKLAKEYGTGYVGSEEYFRTIDSTMRKRFPDYFGSTEQDDSLTSNPVYEEEPPRRAPNPVVAPASRSTPPGRIKLKASQAAIAKRLGVPLELYAKQVAQLNRGE